MPPPSTPSPRHTTVPGSPLRTRCGPHHLHTQHFPRGTRRTASTSHRALLLRARYSTGLPASSSALSGFLPWPPQRLPAPALSSSLGARGRTGSWGWGTGRTRTGSAASGPSSRRASSPSSLAAGAPSLYVTTGIYILGDGIKEALWGTPPRRRPRMFPLSSRCSPVSRSFRQPLEGDIV